MKTLPHLWSTVADSAPSSTVAGHHVTACHNEMAQAWRRASSRCAAACAFEPQVPQVPILPRAARLHALPAREETTTIRAAPLADTRRPSLKRQSPAALVHPRIGRGSSPPWHLDSHQSFPIRSRLSVVPPSFLRDRTVLVISATYGGAGAAHAAAAAAATSTTPRPM